MNATEAQQGLGEICAGKGNWGLCLDCASVVKMLYQVSMRPFEAMLPVHRPNLTSIHSLPP
eukprot:scaffold74745_cov28-Tisochrysis_lutea.AAC.1